ncbi:helix-turn-helix domain-containing protein [Cellulomonas sp.]|uniref:winged helix-turn-helix transcriptional regulator n=1 Tax=Cellulomonas sp. TaxID=40001 RepID=UPI0028116692|nr:helix-turn-helix domain-containing protein [Cellulomonas sp.]
MQRTDFSRMSCSIARTLHVVGEVWSPLVLRDVLMGLHRFDEIRADLGVSRKVLTERLGWLVEQDVLERVPYSDRPPRSEYRLTERGRELCEVLLVMSAWGDRWLAGPDGPPVRYRHRTCGEVTHAEVRCARCGGALHVDDLDLPADAAVADAS